MSTHDWPDPDEVRKALDSRAGDPTIIAAARAYLRLREAERELMCSECGGPVTAIRGALGTIYNHECPLVPHQSAEPALTIEQVIAVCGDTDDSRPYLTVQRYAEPDGWRAWVCTGGALIHSNLADTPEAAIEQLGRDAIAKIKERHAADAQKLKELGVEP